MNEPVLGPHGSFLPYHHSSAYRGFRLSNDPVLALVKLGSKAVPALLEHHEDERKTKAKIEHLGGFDSMVISCDEGEDKNVNEKLDYTKSRGSRYTFRVGNFCYATLGEIVNRDYNLISYGPIRITCVTSVPYSAQLILDIRKEWKKFTPDKHRESLVKDFIKEPNRGAWTRLAYYYSDLLETHALQQLNRGNYEFLKNVRSDRSMKFDNAVRDVLFKTVSDTPAMECVQSLAGRGFDQDIEAYINRGSPTATDADLKEMKRMIGWTRLHVAVHLDIPFLIEQALNDKVDLNSRSGTGETALHLTTNMVALKLLLAKADPNIADGNGMLPFEEMAYRENDACVRKLVAAGSKIPRMAAYASGPGYEPKEVLRSWGLLEMEDH